MGFDSGEMVEIEGDASRIFCGVFYSGTTQSKEVEGDRQPHLGP